MRLLLTILIFTISATPASVNAKAKPGRFIVDPKAETVLDNTTKLTWQRIGVQSKNWKEAKDYCNTLSLAGGGWRLPALRELRSIVDFGKYAPAIDNTIFPAPPNAFWSATLYAGAASKAWFVTFFSGQAANTLLTDALSVRCVR